ncbi:MULTISPECIES: DUF4251 domain-containing protein [Aequorivita]|uniref:DUF4251 domain-containing protein n=1 Tax=Aequorivita iocasae TaxID=2803865 RepID=A0ABX7DPW7_9FLAO|nr:MULTISPECIES: DUF4251 domain-containing protein [Aequorivita]QQX75467.1 DUF4251 domain-containing protein [Aequorivita iocasae]UCA54918.1 DUF4251 domain-containing protein [Aequorivita sp. F7]
MKKRIFLFIALFCFTLSSLNAQNKTTKTQPTAETEQTQTEILLNSKNFEFIANTAIPLSGPTKNLVGSNYSITFTPEMVTSNMPFYGRAYSGMIMGRDKGMRFKGKPEDFIITSAKNGYNVTTTIKGETDIYVISISVGYSSFATLSISSNDRGTISYQGEIVNNE